MSNKVFLGKGMVPQKKVLRYQDAIAKIREYKERGLKAILAQGAFDIIHIGHIDYLRSAKKHGDILFVGVENDNCVRLNKGKKRPVNNLQERLDFLSELQCVDFVFGFPDTPTYVTKSFDMYTRRYSELNPNAIAVSSWDQNLEEKKLQAKVSGTSLIIVNYNIKDSTTRLLKIVGYE